MRHPLTLAIPLAVLLGFLPAFSGAVPEISVILDGKSPGRTFEGIGLVNSSGTSKLLRDYPPDERQDILDLLFRPKFGAGFSIVKNEIGADVNSSTGTEPCHQRSASETPVARGVNFWMAREAKSREPSMRFAAARWGLPAWAAASGENKRDYYLSFVRLMADNGTPLDHLSPEENEARFDRDWVVGTLRPALDAAGFMGVSFVAKDEVQNWTIAHTIGKDRTLKRMLAALTSHYITTSSEEAKDCGLPLYNDEADTPMRGLWPRLMLAAKNLAKQYVDGRMVHALYQPALDGVYEAVKYNYKGVLTAFTPWSGHYEAHPSLWMTAHFTQFASPGWRFLDTSCGKADEDNYYLALRSPDSEDYSVILVNAGQTDTGYLFKIGKKLSLGPLHVWRTDETASFARLEDIAPQDKAFRVTVPARSIVSLTTTTGQQKGEPIHPVPLDQVLSLPYRDDFKSYAPGDQPRYTLDQAGAFEAAQVDGQKCLRQMVTDPPFEWWDGVSKRDPYTVLGDDRWTDYQVALSILLGAEGMAYVSGRGNLHERDRNVPATGYQAVLRADGRWVLRKVVFGDETELASGKLGGFDPEKWHRLAVRMKGTAVSASLDGKVLADVKDADLPAGQAALGCSYHPVLFRDLAIEPAGASYYLLPVNDRDPAVLFQGDWADEDGNWKDTARTCRKTGTTGSSLEFGFTGTGVCLLGRLTDDGGKAEVYLDGKKMTAVDTYREKPLHRAPLFRMNSLKPGKHRLKLVVTGEKSVKSKCSNIYFDCIEYRPTVQ